LGLLPFQPMLDQNLSVLLMLMLLLFRGAAEMGLVVVTETKKAKRQICHLQVVID
jgi:hypothetical protein